MKLSGSDRMSSTEEKIAGVDGMHQVAMRMALMVEVL